MDHLPPPQRIVPLDHFDTLVSIERARPTEDLGDEPTEFESIGTAFLVGIDEGVRGPNGEIRWHTFLVTANHVIQGESRLYAKFNAQGAATRVPLRAWDARDSWTRDEDADLAIFPIHFERLKERLGADVAYFEESSFIYEEDFDALQVGAGDELFVYGFPLGLAGVLRKGAIVRSGIIARLDDDVLRETGAFMIDCHVYPGMSGGPVLLRPSIARLDSRLSVIGVAVAWIPWAITRENSGLARVVPMRAVRRLLETRPADASDPI
jgi:S1-C subfamily serine protease